MVELMSNTIIVTIINLGQGSQFTWFICHGHDIKRQKVTSQGHCNNRNIDNLSEFQTWFWLNHSYAESIGIDTARSDFLSMFCRCNLDGPKQYTSAANKSTTVESNSHRSERCSHHVTETHICYMNSSSLMRFHPSTYICNAIQLCQSVSSPIGVDPLN